MKKLLAVNAALAIMVSTPLSLAKTTTTTTSTIYDDQGVTKAMPTGDRERLDEIRTRPDSPFEAGLARLAILRTQYKLQEANAMADECIAAQGQNINGFGFICAIFKAGNALLEGDRSSWARQAMEIRQKYYGLLREKDGNPSATLVDIESIDLTKFIHLPAVKVDINQETNSINYEAMPNFFKETRKDQDFFPTQTPYISAKINGNDFRFLVDTGASLSFINTKMAAQLALQPVTTIGSTDTALGISRRLDLAIVDSFVIGGVTLHHWPVGVTDTQVPVIGLDTLARLGAIQMDRKSMTIYGKQAITPSCDKAMRLGSELGGYRMKIAYPIYVNEELSPALLDTGSLSEIIRGTKFLADQEKYAGTRKKVKVSTAHGAIVSNQYTKNVKIQMDKRNELVNMNVDDKEDRPLPYVLGAALLNRHSIFMDFKKGLLCIFDENYASNTP